jgi:hypothetical protein
MIFPRRRRDCSRKLAACPAVVDWHKSEIGNNPETLGLVSLNLQAPDTSLKRTKKPASKSSNENLLADFCGAAGSRTLVQTSSNNAFYMLSLSYFVGMKLAKGQPTPSLVPVISKKPRNKIFSIQTFSMLLPQHRQERFRGKQKAA